MKERKRGKRHALLYYRRLMDRFSKAVFWFGLALAVGGALGIWRQTPPLGGISHDMLLIWGAIFLILSIFIYFTRYFAYVQVFSDHLRIVTPFLRLNISFRRVRSVHPSSFQQIFPPKGLSWAQYRFLEPFFAKTAVVVELSKLPMSRIALRLFLPPQMFLGKDSGLVLLVPDWMGLSTELDSFLGRSLQSNKKMVAAAGWWK